MKYVEQPTSPNRIETIDNRSLRERIIEIIRSGANPVDLKPLLVELNKALGCSSAVYFAPQRDGILNEALQKFQTQVREGYGGVTIHLGDGSSRLALGFNSLEADPAKQVQIYLTKKTSTVESAWEKL